MPELQVKFELIDGATDQVIDADLADGETILGAGINIKASSDVQAGSVVFLLDGVAVRTESVAPYAMFGDSGGDFDEGTLAPGAHTLTAEFFSEGGGNGVSLGSRTITFVVADPAGGAGNGDSGTGTGDTDGTQGPGDTDGGPQAGDFVLAVNAGGGAFTTSDGVTYEADTYGAGGAFSSGAAIAGTQDDAIYQSETWGNFTYDIKLDRGTYDVELNFAEIWGGAASAGKRVFNILVEGKTAVEGLDLSGAHGFQTAVDFIGEVDVTDGFLTIEAIGVEQNAKLSGFSVWQATGNHGSAFSIVENPGGGDTGGGDTGDGETGGGDTVVSTAEAEWRAENGLNAENNDPDHPYYIAYNPDRGIRSEHNGGDYLPSNEIPDGLLLVEWADQLVFQYDGNNNDEDDISALPVAALMTERFGLSDTTTFFYGNNIAEGTNEEQHKELTDGAMFAEALGIDTVDVQADADAAVQQLAAIYNSGQKILSIEGGPMEIVYRALELTNEENLDNIWLLSHSTWNEKYPQIEAGKDQDTRSWYDVANDFPSLKMTDIFDQNGNQNPDEQYDNQNWADLGTSDDPVLRAARDVMEGAGKLEAGKEDDASDAGMLWFALTGNERGNAQEAIAEFESFDFAFDAEADLSFIEDPDVLALFA